MTITSTTLSGLATFVVVFGTITTGVTLWRRRIPGLRGSTALRAAGYLARYAVALEYYGLRRREITSHVDELRADLASIAPDDVTGAIDRLGPPRTLAAEVTSGLLRPSFLRGMVWCGIALLGALAATLFATEAFLGGFEAAAGGGQRAGWSTLGFEVNATMGGDGRIDSVEFTSAWIVVFPAVAFVLGGRLWRWVRRRPAPDVAPQSAG